MVAFRTETVDLTKNFNKYFEIKFVNWEYDYVIQEYTRWKEYKMETCTQEHFHESVQSEFESL